MLEFYVPTHTSLDPTLKRRTLNMKSNGSLWHKETLTIMNSKNLIMFYQNGRHDMYFITVHNSHSIVCLNMTRIDGHTWNFYLSSHLHYFIILKQIWMELNNFIDGDLSYYIHNQKCIYLRQFNAREGGWQTLACKQ